MQPHPLHPTPVRDGEDLKLGMTWGQRQEAAHKEVVPILLLQGKKRDLEIEKVLFHPDYNISGKKAAGIPEFYDYDVALIKLKKKLNYDPTIR